MHEHEHTDTRMGRRFVLALAITSIVFIAEIAGGILSRSLALLSDAGHVFLDVFALAMSYAALRLAQRPADEHHTFGFHRGKVLAALANSLLLFGMVFFIAREAWERWQNPQPINSGLMLGVAVVGLVANLVVARMLHAHDEDDLNARSAFLHVLGGAWRIFRESLHILVEGSPAGVNVREVAAAMGEVEGVQNVHDLHVWSVGPGYVSLSAHVVLGDQALAATQALMDTLKERLERGFGIHHTTIQFECNHCGQCVDAFEGGVCYPRPVAPNGGSSEH